MSPADAEHLADGPLKITGRDRAAQVLGATQGALYFITSILVVLEIKAVPNLIKDTGMNENLAYGWALGFGVFGLMYAVAAVFRFRKPGMAFGLAFSSLIGLTTAVFVYGLGAIGTFGPIVGIYTWTICYGLMAFLISQWLGLNETFGRIKRHEAPGGPGQTLTR